MYLLQILYLYFTKVIDKEAGNDKVKSKFCENSRVPPFSLKTFTCKSYIINIKLFSW